MKLDDHLELVYFEWKHWCTYNYRNILEVNEVENHDTHMKKDEWWTHVGVSQLQHVFFLIYLTPVLTASPRGICSIAEIV